jgi:hypothetical protein
VRRTSNLVGPIFMFDAFPDIGSSFRLVLEPVLASFKSGNIASTWAAGIVLSGLLLIVAFVGRVLVRIVQNRKATRRASCCPQRDTQVSCASSIRYRRPSAS